MKGDTKKRRIYLLQQLKKLQKSIGWTNAQTACACGITESTYKKIKYMEHDPAARSINRIVMMLRLYNLLKRKGLLDAGIALMPVVMPHNDRRRRDPFRHTISTDDKSKDK